MDSEVQRQGFLSGIHVLDLTRSVAGPWTTRMLADAGAEVIKIEPPPTGDFIRQVPFAVDEWTSGIFLQGNSGKESLALDIRSDEGQRLLDRLAEQSHVVVHNLRPAAARRLDLTISRFARLNPTVVFCEISGYGSGPSVESKPGQDLGIQADSGLSSLTGLPNGPIAIPMWSVADTVTAAHTFNAICMALLRARADHVAQHVEMSMVECSGQLHDAGPRVASTIPDGAALVTRAGNYHSTLIVRGVVSTSDGLVGLSAYRPGSWAALARLLGGRWATPPYTDWRHRLAERHAIWEAVDARFGAMPTAEALALLSDAGIPANRVESDWGAVARDERFQRRSAVVAWIDATGRERVLGGRAHDKAEARINLTERGGPRLGADTLKILGRLGLGADDTVALYGAGVIGMEPSVFEEFAELLSTT